MSLESQKPEFDSVAQATLTPVGSFSGGGNRDMLGYVASYAERVRWVRPQVIRERRRYCYCRCTDDSKQKVKVETGCHGVAIIMCIVMQMGKGWGQLGTSRDCAPWPK